MIDFNEESLRNEESLFSEKDRIAYADLTPENGYEVIQWLPPETTTITWNGIGVQVFANVIIPIPKVFHDVWLAAQEPLSPDPRGAYFGYPRQMGEGLDLGDTMKMGAVIGR